MTIDWKQYVIPAAVAAVVTAGATFSAGFVHGFYGAKQDPVKEAIESNNQYLVGLVARFGSSAITPYKICLTTNTFGDVERISSKLTRQEICAILALDHELSHSLTPNK